MIETQFRALHTKLRGIAHELMKRECIDHTLETNAIVGDLYIELCASGLPEWVDSPGVFLAIARRQMARGLVGHARGKGALKRGGGMKRQDGDAVARFARSMTPVEANSLRDRINRILRDAVEAGKLTPRQATSFTLVKLFGHTSGEVFELTSCPVRTIQRDVNSVTAYAIAMLEVGE